MGPGIEKEWPSTRQQPRFRLDSPITISLAGRDFVRGWCHDIGEGGICANVPCAFHVGDEVAVELQMPDSGQTLRARAVVRHARGFRCGFEFSNLDVMLQNRIRALGRNQQTAAYILCPNSPMVWVLHRTLQLRGISQVFIGSPKTLPVPAPHIVVIDSEWPDFFEVMRFFRSETTDSRLVLLAILAPTVSAAEAHHAGADLVLHKPLALERTRKLVDLAYRLVTGSAHPADGNFNGLRGTNTLANR